MAKRQPAPQQQPRTVSPEQAQAGLPPYLQYHPSPTMLEAGRALDMQMQVLQQQLQTGMLSTKKLAENHIIPLIGAMTGFVAASHGDQVAFSQRAVIEAVAEALAEPPEPSVPAALAEDIYDALEATLTELAGRAADDDTAVAELQARAEELRAELDAAEDEDDETDENYIEL